MMWRLFAVTAIVGSLTACGGGGGSAGNGSTSTAVMAASNQAGTTSSSSSTSATTSTTTSSGTSSNSSTSSTGNTSSGSGSSTGSSTSSGGTGTGSSGSTTSTGTTSSGSTSSGTTSTGSTSTTSSKIGLLVPAYFDPGSDQADWNTLISLASQAPLIAVMNPNNGPGTSQSQAYVTNINAVNTAGGRVFGYVHTSYGARALSDVEADVAQYFAWYGIKGIFIDEMASSATSANLSYYQQLAAYIRTNYPSATIVANPGGQFDQAFATNKTADIYIDEEDTQANVHQATQASWESNFPAATFAEISIGTTSDASEAAWLVKNRRIGWLYTTTLPLNPNPYQNLPSDFSAEVSAL